MPNLLLAIVSLSVSLVLGELGLRVVIPAEPRRPFEFRIPHPVFGWVLQPNASYVVPLSDGPVSVTYNSQGWRDLEHTLKKPVGVFRILVLGDSFMEATTVELGQSFPRRVEESARAVGTDTEVINMGVSGYGTLQEYLLFRDIGYQYEPDLVILAFYPSNDLANNSVALASILTSGDAITNTRPFLDPSDSTGGTITPVDFETAQSTYAENQAAQDAERRGLILLRLAQAAVERITFEPFEPNLNGGETSTEPTDQARQQMALLGVNYCVEPAEYTQAWVTTERLLARLKEDVEAAGSTLVVVTVPAIETVSFEYMELVRANAAHPAKLCLEEAPGHTRLKQILLRHGIEQIELLPDFRRVMREGGIQLFQLVEGMHWTPAGHELAAERVVSELFERGLISSR